MQTPKFTKRQLFVDDIEQFVDTSNAIAADMGITRMYQAESILVEWQQPNFDITQASYGIFTEDNLLAGYVIVWAVHDTPVHPWVEWGVHPDYLNFDLSADLLHHADKIGQQIIDRCPPESRISLHTNALTGYKPIEQALIKAGYTPIRSSYDMRLDMQTQPEKPDVPDGFKLRTYADEEDLPNLVHAFQDSFSDHFGHIKRPYDAVLEEFEHWFATDAILKELVIFAIDEQANEIAGYILGSKEEHTPPIGYIDIVGVRPAYRRRGLARMLLLTAFGTYWKRGTKCVTLEVDAKSLTNAVSLYEGAGMVIESQYTRYEKLIRDGQELSKVDES